MPKPHPPIQTRPPTSRYLNAMSSTPSLPRRTFTTFSTSRRNTEGFESAQRKASRTFTPEENGRCLRHRHRKRSVKSPASMPPSERVDNILGHGYFPAHVHGTDNARCLIALALIDRTRSAGRGTGLHPLRGQNNVQGASDSRPNSDGLSQTIKSVEDRPTCARSLSRSALGPGPLDPE